MARTRADDFIQNFRFHVLEAVGTFLTPTAGFRTVATPDVNLGVVEYRDGLTLYTFKQPGLPTIGNMTMTQGATTTISEFFTWIKAAAEGASVYRADLDIDVHDNSNATPANVVKKMQCFDCFPIRNKIFGDLDATSPEVNLREIEVAVENIEEMT